MNAGGGVGVQQEGLLNASGACGGCSDQWCAKKGAPRAAGEAGDDGRTNLGGGGADGGD